MGFFGKKKEQKKAAAPRVSGGPRETTYFGKNMEITGNVSGDGDLIILGALEGEFDLKGKLQVAEPARITGTIKANDISIKGSIQGTIIAVEKVHLDPTAKVKGHINSPKISIMEGARFDGEINMSAKKAQALPTPPVDLSASKDPDIAEKK